MSKDIHISPKGADDHEVLVRVEGVSKKFCRSLKQSLWYGMVDMAGELNPFAKGEKDRANGQAVEELRPGEFWANKDVSFEVRRGECLGLIGHNGAGKTTLLKMLNGLIKPDAGSITVRGRIGALIALGAGFNPILTGRENIYINASVLGLSSQEIEEKMEEIIDFAEIRDFIDSPVQSYSSGMAVRLGFAIATAIDPEILLLDEVLAVGDMSFRIKCYNRIGKLQKNAATILVSHSMSHLATVCDRIFFMSRGSGRYYENRNEGIQKYIATQTAVSGGKEVEPLITFELPITSASVKINRVKIQHGDDLSILIAVESSEDVNNLQLRCAATAEEGNPLLVWDGSWTGRAVSLQRGRQNIRLSLGPIHLTSGRYKLNLMLIRPGSSQLMFYSHQAVSFEITNKEIFSEIHTTFGFKELAVDPSW